MQETLAEAPFFDPPLEKFRNLYGQWANSSYGLIITGQVQIDIRCMLSFDHLRSSRELQNFLSSDPMVSLDVVTDTHNKPQFSL